MAAIRAMRGAARLMDVVIEVRLRSCGADVSFLLLGAESGIREWPYSMNLACQEADDVDSHGDGAGSHQGVSGPKIYVVRP